MDYVQTCEWQEGEPSESGWYIVTYTGIDNRREVDWVWFNPHANPCWWIGNAGPRSEPFTPKVTHWMEPPKAPSL